MTSITATTYFFVGAFSGVAAAVVIAAVVLGVLHLVDTGRARRAARVRVPADASSLTLDGQLVTSSGS